MFLLLLLHVCHLFVSVFFFFFFLSFIYALSLFLFVHFSFPVSFMFSSYLCFHPSNLFASHYLSLSVSCYIHFRSLRRLKMWRKSSSYLREKKKNWRWNCWGVQRPPLRSKTNIDWTFFETFTVPNNRPRMYDVLSRRFVLPKLGTFNIYLRHFESFFTHVSKCVPRIPSPPQNIKFYNLGIQSCQNICSPLIKTLHICYWPWHLGYFGYSIWKKHNSLKIFNLDSM
jgi:hypothetical protein